MTEGLGEAPLLLSCTKVCQGEETGRRLGCSSLRQSRLSVVFHIHWRSAQKGSDPPERCCNSRRKLWKWLKMQQWVPVTNTHWLPLEPNMACAFFPLSFYLKEQQKSSNIVKLYRVLSESLPGWEAVAYKQQHTDSWVLLIFINERLWVYEWRLSEILSKLKVFAHSEGEQALAALQRRQRWMLSERVHGVWLCRVSALHQSLPPWHLASPPCGWSSVNHQLLKGGQKKSLTLYGRSLDLGEEKLSLSAFPCWAKCFGWSGNVFFFFSPPVRDE